MILRIYLIALLTYSVLTLPSLFIPVMYVYSLFLAIVYGFIALALFAIFYLLVSTTKYKHLFWNILIISIPISVTISYIVLCYATDISKPLEAGWLFLFPIAAIISGWISLSIHTKSLNQRFTTKETI